MTSIEHLKRLDPELSRILWDNDGREAALSHVVQERRGISRQAANGLLSRLVAAGLLTEGAGKRPKTYNHPLLASLTKEYPIDTIEEHVVWVEDFRRGFAEFMGDRALKIWDYGFTEMLNNAIEHSQGTSVTVRAEVYAGGTVCWIEDNGEGIFKRITRLCRLADERQAILELAKGKLTTDPENHTGEGVFFSSRAFDRFHISAGGLIFDHTDGQDDFLFERDQSHVGTWVMMAHGNHTERNLTEVFDEYAEADEYTFSKTVVPVRLARIGAESLVSRSQAQRLLARVDRFKTVLFDFRDVETIGQAFADEIFRVYANAHPEVQLVPIHASVQVEQMIGRATAPRL
jgi:anti-sigma regulatory factor (Ser/Thr protein kinase)